jgi:hypothetical protein
MIISLKIDEIGVLCVTCDEIPFNMRVLHVEDFIEEIGLSYRQRDALYYGEGSVRVKVDDDIIDSLKEHYCPTTDTF